MRLGVNDNTVAYRWPRTFLFSVVKKGSHILRLFFNFETRAADQCLPMRMRGSSAPALVCLPMRNLNAFYLYPRALPRGLVPEHASSPGWEHPTPTCSRCTRLARATFLCQTATV